MDSSSDSAFDFSGELWRFVRSRFTSQAKAIKGTLNQPLAHCLDVIAAAHGFTSWRGLSKTLDALCAVERLYNTPDLDTHIPVNRSLASAARYSFAIAECIHDIEINGLIVDWPTLEQALRHPPKLTVNDLDDSFDVFEGIFYSYHLRKALFYKAAWIGKSGQWSNELIDAVCDVSARFEELLDGDQEQASQYIRLMYGSHPDDWIDFWDMSTAENLAYDIEIENILDHGLEPSEFLKSAAEIYRLANKSILLDVTTLRIKSVGVHYGSLDMHPDDSFVAALIRVNAPSDAYVELHLTSLSDETPSHQFLLAMEAYAPSAQKAAQMGACLSGIPRIFKMTEDQVRSRGLPNASADWHAVCAE